MSPSEAEALATVRQLGRGIGLQVKACARGLPQLEAAVQNPAERCVGTVPKFLDALCARPLELIDVMWFDATGDRLIAAFCLEHRARTVRGVARLIDLIRVMGDSRSSRYFLVGARDRVIAVRADAERLAARLASEAVFSANLRFLAVERLRQHCASATLGAAGIRVLDGISRPLWRRSNRLADRG